MSDAVLAAIVSGSCAVTASAVAVVLGAIRPRKALAAVHEQVANTHSTNLREDVDQVLDELRLLRVGQVQVIETQHIHGEAIANLRTDTAWNRRELADLRRTFLEGVA